MVSYIEKERKKERHVVLFILLLFSSYAIYFTITAGRRITGPIPMELKVLHNLSYLDLSSNNLTGGIPTGLSLLDSLGKWIMSDLNCLHFSFSAYFLIYNYRKYERVSAFGQ